MYDNRYDSIYDYTVYDIAFDFDDEEDDDESSFDTTQTEYSEIIIES